jgi:hypothetical protein
MGKPILFLVSQESSLLGALRGDIDRRFGNDCRILSEGSPKAVFAALESLAVQKSLLIHQYLAGQRRS